MLAAAVPLAAQTTVTANAGVAVSATNNGNFSLTIITTDTTPNQYLFGTISSTSASNSGGTDTLTNGVADTVTVPNSMTFTSSDTAITWTVASAPSRTVRIYNSSSASPTGWGTLTNLKLHAVNVGTATPCNEITLGTTGDGTGCTNGELVDNITSVGKGSSAKSGNLTLKVTVTDTTMTGLASWAVQLTALGS